MLRGANRQEIFHEEEDSNRFLETLERYKKEYEIKIYGWCLMGNHIHILLQAGKEELALTMKRIGVSYAWFYNWKYKTTGHFPKIMLENSRLFWYLCFKFVIFIT